jgi:hypothetical protein
MQLVGLDLSEFNSPGLYQVLVHPLALCPGLSLPARHRPFV